MPLAMPNFNLKLSIPDNSLVIFVLALTILFGMVFTFYPTQALADAGIPDQLVPCSGVDCTVCNLYDGVHNIIDFLLFAITLPLAVVAIIAGGVMLLISGGSEERVSRGKSILSYAIIGILIAFSAWVIVNTILNTLAFQNPVYGGPWSDYSFCSEFEKLKAGAVSVAPPSALRPPALPPSGLPPGTRSHEVAVEFLEGSEIRVTSSTGCLGENRIGCTTLEGIPSLALAKIFQVKRECSRTLPACNFTISGGTETVGHGANTEHGPGKGTVDIQTSNATTYILLKALFLTQGAQVQCELEGTERSVDCGGTQGTVNHLHVNGL